MSCYVSRLFAFSWLVCPFVHPTFYCTSPQFRCIARCISFHSCMHWIPLRIIVALHAGLHTILCVLHIWTVVHPITLEVVARKSEGREKVAPPSDCWSLCQLTRSRVCIKNSSTEHQWQQHAAFAGAYLMLKSHPPTLRRTHTYGHTPIVPTFEAATG